MAAPGSPARRSGIDWRRLAGTPAAALAVWAAYSLIRLALPSLTGINPGDPDDYMRLLQVRDLLAGQSWFDVSQYRIDPPHGAAMHWSRIVDLPLAVLVVLFGESAALALAPLLYLLPVLLALQAIMKRLGLAPRAIWLGLAILPLFPLVLSNFAPARIDHHTPQAAAAICCAALLLGKTRRSAALCGLLAAAWLTISLEGLPLVAVLAALYGLRYLLGGERLLAWFLSFLALAAPAFAFATRPLSDLAGTYCDILLPGHMAAFAAAAAIAALLPFLPGQANTAGRFAGLGVIPLVCAPLAFVALGQCAADPFAQMDPLLQTYWHGFVLEGLPLWRQAPSVILMLLWTIALIPAGWLLAGKLGLRQHESAMSWNLLALFALAAGAYSLALMREGLIAQLLAVPFSALLLAHYLPRARALASMLGRVGATFGLFVVATPTLASAAMKPLDRHFGGPALQAEALAMLRGAPCDYTRLDALPAGHVFAPLDRGPEILFRTRHTVVMAPYHRNQARMTDVVAAFTGDPARAEALVRNNRADYVLVCTSGMDSAIYRTARPDNLANMLAQGGTPGWLEPAPGFSAGSLKVYRVRP